jgi:hypothetical protein
MVLGSSEAYWQIWSTQALLPPPQLAQTAPPLPHLLSAVPAWHELPLQQPAQPVASQAHEPPTHVSPAAHGPLAPHWHPRVGEQLSAATPQALQVAPGAPQLATDSAWQAPATQQPAGHEDASHTHAAEEQRWPARHAAAAPHRHSPVAEQASPAGPQSVQAAPAAAQAVAERVVQALPRQQPSAQEVASQTQPPATQRWPASQAAPVPHRQPEAPQRSARSASQAWQEAAWEPQASIVAGDTQAEPWQQPAAHVAGLQVPQ